MNYTFDKIINRKNTYSLKHDLHKEFNMPDNLIPLWVADMDFQAPNEVIDAIMARAKHGIFGYSEPDETYFNAVHSWYLNRFSWDTKSEWLVKTPGVVFAIACTIKALTKENDSVLIQKPVYYPFSSTVINNNRRLVNNPLIYENNKYTIDFVDFEKKIIDNNVKLFILCSPHNPVGRVWTKDELRKMGDLCFKHNVIIVADEIHSDFIWKDNTHTVFASISEEFAQCSIICTSPSKTFNLAGLQVSNIWIKNNELREKFKLEIVKTGFEEINAFGLTACRAAYEHGDKWLLEVKDYIYGNITFIRDFLAQKLPDIKLVEPEGTYLVWLDFRKLGLSMEELNNLIVNKAGLWLDDGTMFGDEGRGFQRINVTSPRSVIKEALEQLYIAFKNCSN